MKMPLGPRERGFWSDHSIRGGLHFMLWRSHYWLPIQFECVMWCWPCDCPWCVSHDEEVRSMKMPVIGASSDDGDEPPRLSEMLRHMRELNELVSDPRWDEEHRKGERALFAFWDLTGTVRVILKVANPPLKLSTVGPCLDDAMAALQLTLESADVPWQADDRPLKGPPKKPKKGS